MPDKRGHRGPHPEDHRLFAPDQWPALRTAVADLSLLLSRDYAMDSSLKLVGDHFQLDSRQRLAVMRASCSDQSLALRYAHAVPPEQLRGHVLHLDGYNVLTTIESALGHGIVIQIGDCPKQIAVGAARDSTGENHRQTHHQYQQKSPQLHFSTV